MFSEKVKYIGVDDTDLDLFESQYRIPQGMCYNSYVLMADSITVMDTVDRRKTDEWMAKLEAALNGAKPTYLVVQHVEPDHSGSVIPRHAGGGYPSRAQDVAAVRGRGGARDSD